MTDSTGMAQRSLAELACVLFIITLLVNIVARSIMRGADRRAGSARSNGHCTGAALAEDLRSAAHGGRSSSRVLVAVIGVLFCDLCVRDLARAAGAEAATLLHADARHRGRTLERDCRHVHARRPGPVIVIVVGLGTAIWTAEFAPPWAKRVIRFMVDVLAGVPSIVVGYFLYVALVEEAGLGFLARCGRARARDLHAALRRARRRRRAQQCAAGAKRRRGRARCASGDGRVRRSTFPYALPGILTGLLVATGIGLGETAPLIYTAGWSNYMPTLQLTHSPVGYLTYVVWTYISQPFEQSHQLAYAAAALLMIFVFVTNLLARSFVEYRLGKHRGH